MAVAATAQMLLVLETIKSKIEPCTTSTPEGCFVYRAVYKSDYWTRTYIQRWGADVDRWHALIEERPKYDEGHRIDINEELADARERIKTLMLIRQRLRATKNIMSYNGLRNFGDLPVDTYKEIHRLVNVMTTTL
jgi:hypothetical protein